MTAEPLALFDLEQAPAPRTKSSSAARASCVYCVRPSRHRITHQLVWAVNLMCPRWWKDGGLHPDGSLRDHYGARVSLYGAVGGVCTEHVSHPVYEMPGGFKVGHIAPIGAISPHAPRPRPMTDIPTGGLL